MSTGAWKDDIHIFNDEGREILFQVSSGVFFEIDTLVKDVLDLAHTHTREDLVASLLVRYDLNEVLGVVQDLEANDILSFGPVPDTACVDESLVRGSSAPLDMTLHISHGCNITCTYCFALGGDYGKKPGMMDWKTGKQAIDWLLTGSQDAGKCNVTFFGGEPLLNFDLIKQLVPYARAEASLRDIEITFSITTNGTLLSSEAFEFIMLEDIAVVVSLDGDAETHNRIRLFHDGRDTYDVIAENTRNATRKRSEKMQVRATMTSQNLDIEDIASHLSTLGASSVKVAPTMEHPSSPTAIRESHLPELKKHLKKLRTAELDALIQGQKGQHSHFGKKLQQVLNPSKKDYGCGGGKTFFGVSVDGGIYFCSAFASMPEFKMGDVFNGLDDGAKQKFDTELHIDNRTSCRSCWARNLCGGGCAYDAQVVNGSHVEPNPASCEQIRYSYELAMGMALLLQKKNPEVFDAFCEA